MTFWRVPSYLLAITLVIAACARNEGIATDSTPTSDLRPEAGWYTLRYASAVAPLIVHCMNELGWVATYDPQLGALLPEIPLPQALERDEAIGFCVAGSHTHRMAYLD